MLNQNPQELIAKIKQLEEELRKVKSCKRYGLVWEEKPEIFEQKAKDALPILKEDKSLRIEDSEQKPNNIIIEGDNFHSLSVLNYTHKGKIDVIYIDPPYNTGNKDFIYNDHYVDKEDTYRHSKWLSFMNKRLKLAKELLSINGVILFSIDENEFAQLKLLCDEIFGEQNFIGNIAVINNLKGRSDDKYLATAHEFSFIYAKNINFINLNGIKISDEQKNEYKFKDNIGKYKKIGLRKTGKGWKREDRPNMFYPIYFNEKTKEISLNELPGYIKILPLTKDGKEGRWRWGKDTFKNKYKTEIIIEKTRNGNYVVYSKMRLTIGEDVRTLKVKSVFLDTRYDSGKGTNEIKSIFGDSIFTNPKPKDFIKDLIEISSKSNSIILDFFAGSGTTGHATMELNKEDGGNRQFILCSSRENTKEEPDKNICRDITYERNKRVILGYTDSKGKKVEGLGGNLNYYTTEFIKTEKSIDDLRYKFINMCDDLLSVKENTFTKVDLERNIPEIKLFKKQNKFTAILYDIHFFDDLKDILKNINGEISVYIFSLSNDIFEEELIELNKNITLQNIPDPILETYKKIFNF